MQEPTSEVELIGIYKVDKEEDVHLIELGIKTNHGTIEIGEFTQKQDGLDQLNWQTPWDEKFLNESGTKITGDWMNAPTDKSDFTRLAFFLHFIDLEKPLSTQFGNVELRTVEEMPKRLADIIEYERP